LVKALFVRGARTAGFQQLGFLSILTDEGFEAALQFCDHENSPKPQASLSSIPPGHVDIHSLFDLLKESNWSSMAKKKRRTHTITVRLSEEEYFALREVSASDGIRSMSEITRKAVNTILPGGRKQEDESENCMEELRANIKDLENRLERVEAMLPCVDTELAIRK
jgi:hypothetical protein